MKPQPDEKHELPKVEKLFGSPGCGKTTTMVGNPNLGLNGLFIDHLDYYDLDDQLLVTYTNAACDEATERMEKMLDVPKYKIADRATTIHGQCYRKLDLEWKQTVDYRNRQNFCKKFGIEFGYDDKKDDIMGADLDEGNALFRVHSWIKSNRLPFESWKECPIDWDYDSNPLNLMREWEQYKDHHNLMDYSDMIEDVIEWGYEYLEDNYLGVPFPGENTRAIEMFVKAQRDPSRDPDALRGQGPFIDAKVLYVDEAQDMTPLQFAWYQLQKNVVEKAYIAGDDDQTIYSWQGADPNLLIEEEGETNILDRTYRLPENIWDICEGVIEQADDRVEKEVDPDGEGGQVDVFTNPSMESIGRMVKEGNWLILFRANYMVNEFSQELSREGVPYRNMSTFDHWDEEFETLRDAMSQIHNQEDTMSGDELEVFLEYAPDSMINSDSVVSETERVMGNFGGITMEKVREMVSLREDGQHMRLSMSNFLEASNDINYYQKQAIQANVRKGNEDLDPNRIRMGTIHSAKGKEEENVLVATDSTKTILEEMAKELKEDHPDPNPDYEDIQGQLNGSERRVYYVGMSRAEERLVLAHNVLDDSVCIPLSGLLSEEHYEEYVEADEPELQE